MILTVKQTGYVMTCEVKNNDYVYYIYKLTNEGESLELATIDRQIAEEYYKEATGC